MENLIIERSKYNPSINFNADGRFVMEGNAIPSHSVKFFDPILEWVRKHRFKSVIFTINLYYFNTSVAKMLLSLFYSIREQMDSDDYNVNWYYEEGDEDNYDHGKYYQRMVPEANFKFFEYEEAPAK